MKGVLVDTSVWIQHFRRRNVGLVSLLESDLAMTHPIVCLELACGTPPAPRAQTLHDLKSLLHTQQASLNEAQDFVEREKLYGLGCGLVDMILLASTLITPQVELWTLDRRLADLSERFGVMHRPARH
jgi:predicted nucleic acid-binding protein